MELKIEMKTAWQDEKPSYILEEDFSDPTASLKLEVIEGNKIWLSSRAITDLIQVLQLIQKRWGDKEYA